MAVPTFLKKRQQKTEAKYSRNRQLLESAFAKPSKTRDVDVLVGAPAKKKNTYKEDIDWARGRFSGQAVQIIVKDGVIAEKIYLTPKGSTIRVKRKELGFFAWLFNRK